MEERKDLCLFKIKLYQYKAHNMFNHIEKLMKKHDKYVFSEACAKNLELYFDQIAKMVNWIKEYEKVSGNKFPFDYDPNFEL